MANIFLSTIINTHEPQPDDKYPFNIPVIKHLKELNFTTSVTYIIGENGSGKSTLLEAIAVRMGMNAEGEVVEISISGLQKPILSFMKP